MTADENYFWEIAASLIRDPRVSRSTMMGLPCLRWDGQFFASYDRRAKNLIVKLPESRVSELIAVGHADPFAPAGRRFRQWAAISSARQERWSELLTEAQSFVAAEAFR